MLCIRPVEGTIGLACWLDPDWVIRQNFTLPSGLLDPTDFNRVRLEAVGGEFRVFVNGTFIFEFTDTTLMDPGIFGFLMDLHEATIPLKKVIVYATTDNDSHGWFWVVEEGKPTTITLTGEGLYADRVYALVVDSLAVDNSGSATLTFTKQ